MAETENSAWLLITGLKFILGTATDLYLFNKAVGYFIRFIAIERSAHYFNRSVTSVLNSLDEWISRQVYAIGATCLDGFRNNIWR